jgi:hypothetical protein
VSGSRRLALDTDHALYAEMARIHLTCRVLARGLQVLSRDGVAVTSRQRAVLTAWIAADLAVWIVLRRQRIPLLARLALDLCDVAYWASRDCGRLEPALASEIAVELEAGFVSGLAALAVPALEAAVSTVARRAVGRRPEPSVHLAHVGAVGAGIAARRAETTRLGRAQKDHDSELSAKRVRAFLAGQHDVAMGAASVVDLLTPIAIMLGAANEDSALYEIRTGWKRSLAEQARQHAMYLDEAVRLWEQLHNDHPDLSGYVVTTVAEGAGTTLLTRYQADALTFRLESLPVRGPIHIDLSGAERVDHRRPGRALSVLIDGEPYQLPADPSLRIGEVNPAPPVFAFAAVMALNPIRRPDGAVPPLWAALSAIGFAAAGANFIGKPALQTAPAQVGAGVALAALQGAICARFAEVRRTSAGAHLFHGTYGIAPVLLLLSTNWERLSIAERVEVLSALAAIASASYLIAERPRSARDLACALAWPLAAFVGSTGVNAATARQSELLAGRLRAEDDRVESAQFAEGRRSVLNLVTAALAEAEATAVDPSLDPDVREIVIDRLIPVRSLLTRISQTG